MTAAPSAVARRPRRAARRPRRLAGLLAAVATVALVASSCVPPDFVKHTSGDLFTWFAPPDWLASYSTNGIQISSPTGAQQVVLAFAPVGCVSAPTWESSATQFFNAQRRAVRDSSGLSDWRTLSATPARLLPAQTYGPLYFRQDITFSGRAPNGTLMRGEGSLDYQRTGFGFGCAYRNQLRVAPATQFATVIARLRSTQDSISYFPPGVP